MRSYRFLFKKLSEGTAMVEGPTAVFFDRARLGRIGNPRDPALLVKPGRGNNGDALKIAKKVLDGVRAKYPQGFAPLVYTSNLRDVDLRERAYFHAMAGDA